MKPTVNNILVLQAEKVSKVGSIFIADSAQEEDNTGLVIAVGPGKLSKDDSTVIPMQVKVGDTVMFAEKGAVSVNFEGKKHLLLSEDIVLAVL